MSPLVMKFGGSSVGDASRIAQVGTIVGANRNGGVLVVVSAMGGVTNLLFEAARTALSGDIQTAIELRDAIREKHFVAARNLGSGLTESLASAITAITDELGTYLQGIGLLRELSERSMDTVASIGERLSGILVAQGLGVPCVDARLVMRTDSRFGQAKPQPEAIREFALMHFMPLLGAGRVLVTQGYIGADASGTTTTLGRGGSDYSASLFGAALDASEIQIWTDVEGVLSCDPRVVPGARPVEILGYEEAAELAAYGAKVLHPATIKPAVEAGIPVTVRNTMLPNGRFTTIRAGASSGLPVTALAVRKGIAIVNLRQETMMDESGFLARLFDVFGARGTSVDLVSTSEVCVSVTVDMGSPLELLEKDLSVLGSVEISRDRAVVALVGERLRQTPAVLATAFKALGGIGVEMISMGANEINLSLVMKSEDSDEALRRLHAAFFEGEEA
jgi:aspartate kinase